VVRTLSFALPQLNDVLFVANGVRLVPFPDIQAVVDVMRALPQNFPLMFARAPAPGFGRTPMAAPPPPQQQQQQQQLVLAPRPTFGFAAPAAAFPATAAYPSAAASSAAALPENNRGHPPKLRLSDGHSPSLGRFPRVLSSHGGTGDDGCGGDGGCNGDGGGGSTCSTDSSGGSGSGSESESSGSSSLEDNDDSDDCGNGGSGHNTNAAVRNVVAALASSVAMGRPYDTCYGQQATTSHGAVEAAAGRSVPDAGEPNSGDGNCGGDDSDDGERGTIAEAAAVVAGCGWAAKPGDAPTETECLLVRALF